MFVATFAIEIYLLLAPSSKLTEPSPFVDHKPWHGTIFNRVFPYCVTYQHVRFLHQTFFLISVALSRVAPVLVPSLVYDNPATDRQVLKAMAERLDVLTKSTEQESKHGVLGSLTETEL